MSQPEDTIKDLDKHVTEMIKTGKRRKKVLRPRIIAHDPNLLARRRAEQDAQAEEREARMANALARAGRAAGWLVANRPDLTMGNAPTLHFIGSDTVQASLVEFEDTYRGDAKRVHTDEFGEIWWADPEARQVHAHHFALRSEQSNFAIEYELHFSK